MIFLLLIPLIIIIVVFGEGKESLKSQIQIATIYF